MLACTCNLNAYTNAKSFILTASYSLYSKGLQSFFAISNFNLNYQKKVKPMVNQDLFRTLENLSVTECTKSARTLLNL